jgi:hypothetical protein
MMGNGRIDTYLECVSMLDAQSYMNLYEFLDSVDDVNPMDVLLKHCKLYKPIVPILEQQQVSSIAVLERCKSNYQQKQWDVGAFMLYDTSRVVDEVTVPVPYMPLEEDEAGRCLLRAEKNRESNLACMDSYISASFFKQGSPTVYWRYEKAYGPSATTAYSAQSDDVDACIVFSGQAKRSNASIGEATAVEFRRCSHDYEETGCMIPHMVWSASSANKVPVAKLHAVEEVHSSDREQVSWFFFDFARLY